jgi:hypothetical protein
MPFGRASIETMDRHALNHVGELSRIVRTLVHVVHHHGARRLVDEIDNVVERARQRVYIFAVEGRDERLVELGRDGMRQIIARMLDGLDALGVLDIIAVLIREHLDEHARRVVNVRSHLREKREVLLFLR